MEVDSAVASSGCSTINELEAARGLQPNDEAKNLITAYHKQFTAGCDTTRPCANPHCAKNPEYPIADIEPNAAAVEALKLAIARGDALLCARSPPLLSLPRLRHYVDEARASTDFAPLVAAISATFSDSNALGGSFWLSAPAHARAQSRLDRLLEINKCETHELLRVDADAVVGAYDLLLGLDRPEVVDALMTACEMVLCKLRVAMLASPSEFSSYFEGAALGQLAILLANPLLLDPAYHKSVLAQLLVILSEIAPNSAGRLVEWLSQASAPLLRRMVAIIQQFLTVRLYHTQRIDAVACAATRALGILYSANTLIEEDAALEALHYSTFYNDAVNSEVNLKEDYLRWRSDEEGTFSFCEEHFVLDTASKSRILQYDATAQMTQVFEGALIRSLFVGGAQSPYLVLRVRRQELVSDTLLRISQQRRDLKKPLKVQFVGEEGVDEGGVQKEFFQLIIAQIFDVSFGMFTLDEEQRTYWFNRSSLENTREFELIGILLALAIYNGVILDVHFPHVVYKKLVQRCEHSTFTTGDLVLADVVRDFPRVGRSLTQLLEYEPADEVESTFCLVMQVDYEEFGVRKTHDLVEGGGDIAVTAANRAEYVRLYTRYLLHDSIEPQFSAFSAGFHNVCGGDCLGLFRWEELELLVCGSPELDFHALETAAQYDDGFSPEHPSIRLLWEVVHELPMELKRKFLFFTTGSDRVPIKGLGNMNFVISRNGVDEERLPSAHTCFNHLLLPEYRSKEKLHAQILRAISDTEGFHIV